MLLFDVNVLVYAHREDTAGHDRIRQFLEDELSSDRSFGWSSLVFSGFLRVVTHPRIFTLPTDLHTALAFADGIAGLPNAVAVEPGDRHWELFVKFCTQSSAKGNLIPDAYLAALALEHGCTWVSTDGDYARFKGLKILNPLKE